MSGDNKEEQKIQPEQQTAEPQRTVAEKVIRQRESEQGHPASRGKDPYSMDRGGDGDFGRG